MALTRARYLAGLLAKSFFVASLLLGCATTAEHSEYRDIAGKPIFYDFARLRAEIPVTPAFVSDRPLFQILLFEGGIPVWMVLDTRDSSAGPHDYDVLYIDLDADGDLTDPEERLVADYRSRDAWTPAAENAFLAVWQLERFVHPGTGAIQTEVEFSWTHSDEQSCLSFYFDCQANRGFEPSELAEMLDKTIEEIGDPTRWINQRGYSGPAGMGAAPIAPPSAEIGSAPIYVIGDHRDWPVSMTAARRRSWDQVLSKSTENDLTVRFLVEGDSAGATTAIDLDYLPQGEPVLVSLRYTTNSGKIKQVDFELEDRC